MSQSRTLQTPLSPEIISSLRAGEKVSLSGTVYTARDAAHKRLVALLEEGKALPFDIRGQTVYYAGPCPAAPNRVVGSIGPTTSGRMDTYAPRLMEEGLCVMIGKGNRNRAVISAIQKYNGVYLAAVGGVGALLAGCVMSCQTVVFEDLGTEAIRRLAVKDMPLWVAIDNQGRNIYDR